MKKQFYFLWMVLAGFSAVHPQTGQMHPVASVLDEIIDSIEYLNRVSHRLNREEILKIISNLNIYHSETIILPDTVGFDSLRERLFRINSLSDELANNLALRTRHEDLVLPLTEAYSQTLILGRDKMRAGFKSFYWIDQFRYVIPLTQSMHAFNGAFSNLLVLAVSIIPKIKAPEIRKNGWQIIEKIYEQIELEKLTYNRTLHRDVLIVILERLIQLTDQVKTIYDREPDEAVKQAANGLVTRFCPQKEQLLVQLKETREWKDRQNAMSAEFWFEKGEAATALNEKIAFYSRAIQINPKGGAVYNNRGNAFENAGNYPAALKDYSQAIALEPGNARTYFNRGNVLYKLTQYQEAILDFNQTLRFNPGFGMAYNNRGNCYRQLGDFQQAIDDYSRAVQLEPSNAQAYNNRGICYKNLKQYDRAVQDLKKAIEIDPDYDNAYYNLGSVYWAVRQWHEVIRAWEKCLEINPNHQKAREWLIKARTQAR